ncbi:MAG TPA: nuclear transport factor 2 family protein [Candidatus Thermoplasmatota archaeon]|nr:nuclear transport factor 2 family protein [Candidatus Thermoplasmatota archaeon]
MDLEQRARSFFTALGRSEPAQVLDFLADGAVYHVEGVLAPMDKPTFERYLRGVRQRLPEATFRLASIDVKRNVTLVEWARSGRRSDGTPDEGHGVHLLSWDQEGRVAHATVHTRVPVLNSGDLN